jgi:hypothetical protein
VWKRAALIGVFVGLVVGALLVWWYSRTRDAADPPASMPGTGSVASNSPTATPDAAAIAGDAAPAEARPKRMTQDQRAALIETIRESYRKRTTTTGATPSGPPPALPEVPVDKEYIRSAVRELIPLLSECYQEGLARDPALQGNVVVDFTIEGEPGVGAVIGESKIVDAKTDLKDPLVQECIAETMHALQISPPANGGTIRVTYPFAFAPE